MDEFILPKSKDGYIRFIIDGHDVSIKPDELREYEILLRNAGFEYCKKFKCRLDNPKCS
jgi:hypothetical protein